jgi:hypothetical protein
MSQCLIKHRENFTFFPMFYFNSMYSLEKNSEGTSEQWKQMTMYYLVKGLDDCTIRFQMTSTVRSLVNAHSLYPLLWPMQNMEFRFKESKPQCIRNAVARQSTVPYLCDTRNRVVESYQTSMSLCIRYGV